MKVVATYAIKGGVGKTSAAVNLAHLAALDGRRTLLWDLDPQGSATYLFRVKPKVKGGGKALVTGTRALDDAVKGTDYEGLDLLPADFTYRHLDLELDALKKPTRRLRRLLEPLGADYDLVVLDCPPNVSLSSESIVHAADLLAVPLVPAALAALVRPAGRVPRHDRKPGAARLLVDGRPPQEAAPRRRGRRLGPSGDDGRRHPQPLRRRADGRAARARDGVRAARTRRPGVRTAVGDDRRAAGYGVAMTEPWR